MEMGNENAHAEIIRLVASVSVACCIFLFFPRSARPTRSPNKYADSMYVAYRKKQEFPEKRSGSWERVSFTQPTFAKFHTRDSE